MVLWFKAYENYLIYGHLFKTSILVMLIDFVSDINKDLIQARHSRKMLARLRYIRRYGTS